MYTLVMAEGDYDPTNEKTTLIPRTGDDDGDGAWADVDWNTPLDQLSREAPILLRPQSGFERGGPVLLVFDERVLPRAITIWE